MRQIWIIAKRELSVFFDSLIAYIMIVLFLVFSGLFTWILGDSIFFLNQASLQVFFGVSYWTLFFFIPALTMRLIAEENRSGTLELLLTKPVNDWQVVTGKFLSTFILILITLLLTLPYYFTIWKLGPVDHGAIWSGYLGLLLLSASYISIGIFASSISQNQIVSILAAYFIGIFFQLVFGILASAVGGFMGSVLNYLSIQTHFESISRGVIDSKDLIYFFSLILIGLIASEIAVAKRNIVEK
jgi:ABC-2 type transport system permease protein